MLGGKTPLDTSSYLHLSAPLYHEPASESESETTEPESDPVFADLLSVEEIAVRNSLNGDTNKIKSIFDEEICKFSETDETMTAIDVLSTDQSGAWIPLEDLDKAEYDLSCQSYSPPRLAAPAPAPAPPPRSPTPPPLDYTFSEPVEQPHPIPCGSPITRPIKVYCNEESGVLHPDMLCRGSRGRCILYHGEWLTPNQFEYHTGRERSKYWKRSLYYEGRSLVLLFREGKLTEHDRSCSCGPLERRDEPRKFPGFA